MFVIVELLYEYGEDKEKRMTVNNIKMNYIWVEDITICIKSC
jgi:hypothetical protein